MLVLLALAAPVHAGPWVRDPGAHYVKVGASHFAASVYDDPAIDGADGLEYTGQLASLYAEVGLPKGLQAVVSTAYARGQNFDPVTGRVYKSRGLGDLGVGLVWDVPVLEAPASLAMTTRIPLYDDGVGSGSHPPLGDPQVDVDLVAAAGQAVPLGNHWVWFVEEVGFKWRTLLIPARHLEPIRANGLTYHLQVGLAPNLGDRSLGWVNLDVNGVYNPIDDGLAEGHHQWSAGLAGSIWQGLNLEAGFTHIYRATHASTGWGVNAGVSWRGKPGD